MRSNKRIIIATGGTGGHIFFFSRYWFMQNVNEVGFDPNLTIDKEGIKIYK